MPLLDGKLPLDRQLSKLWGIVVPSHGALSKAGKVRSITGESKNESMPTPNPRVSNRKAYRRRIILDRNTSRFGAQGGQYDPSIRRRRRRR